METNSSGSTPVNLLITPIPKCTYSASYQNLKVYKENSLVSAPDATVGVKF